MFDQIVYLPKFGADSQTDVEKEAVVNIIAAGKALSINTCAWNVYFHRTPKNTLFISLGGDGTMLTAMREAISLNGEVVGIHFGTVGFLTSIDHTDLESMYKLNSKSANVYLDLIADLQTGGTDNWKYQNRTSVKSNMIAGTKSLDVVAANEILVTTPTRRTPINYELYIDGQFVAKQQGDGVIVSTASGSTAYSLSAGGSIMIPSSTALQIVPLAAHTLTSKPIIVDGKSEINISIPSNQRTSEVSVFNDGRCGATLDNKSKKQTVTISGGKQVKVWYPANWNFFNVLMSKMGW